MSEIAIKKILITQPRPESDKSPYYELARRHEVEMAFLPFIRLEGILSKDFRRQVLFEQYQGGNRVGRLAQESQRPRLTDRTCEYGRTHDW